MLSACVIAKNEEKLLPRLLDSIRGCPEIVVVDTGSTDNTVAIAEAHGATVCHLVWTNFADARNAAADLAKNDWCMWLDADMWFEPGEFDKILDLVSKMPPMVDAIELKIVDPGGTFPSPRIYRKKDLRFTGDVHERFQAKFVMKTLIRVLHQRNETPEARAIKDASYQKILEAELDRDPTSLHAIMYLRDLAMNRKDWDAAERFCLDMIAMEQEVDCFHTEKKKDVDYFNLLDLSLIAYNRKEFEKALEYGVAALKHCATDPRVFLALGDSFNALGRTIDSMVMYRSVLAMPMEARLIASKYSIEEDSYNVVPLAGMGENYMRIGKSGEALEHFKQSLASNPSTKHRPVLERALRELTPIPIDQEPRIVVLSVGHMMPGQGLMFCLETVRQQQYHNFIHVFVAADADALLMAQLFANGHPEAKIMVVDGRGRSEVENMLGALSRLDDDTIVVCLNDDDALTNPGALSTVAKAHHIDGAWATHGSRVFSRIIGQEIVVTDPTLWCSPTFRAGLAKLISDSDFRRPDASYVGMDMVHAVLTRAILSMAGTRARNIDGCLFNLFDRTSLVDLDEHLRIRSLPEYAELPDDTFGPAVALPMRQAGPSVFSSIGSNRGELVLRVE